MKSTIVSVILAGALLAVAPQPASAQQGTTAASPADAAASRTVMDSSTRIINTLQQRRAEFRANRPALQQFIEAELARGFDREYAARLVLGVHARTASPEQVKLFADAMADNLMARYGDTLLQIEGSPRFRLKGQAPLPGNRGVKVSTELLRNGAEPTPVEYLMRQVDGQWKIFDVMIEGISYVQTFKTQFDSPLRQKSIEQVARELRGGTLQAGGNGR